MGIKPTPLSRNLGRRLAELRQQAEMTQDQLAEAYGATRNYIQAVERGTQNLTISTLERFANIFEVQVRDLFEDSRFKRKAGRPRKRGN